MAGGLGPSHGHSYSLLELEFSRSGWGLTRQGQQGWTAVHFAYCMLWVPRRCQGGLGEALALMGACTKMPWCQL